MKNDLLPTRRLILRNLLKDLRRTSGLRQHELAERLGLEQSVISKIETGERRVDLAELSLICDALGTTLGEFVRRFEEAAYEGR